jgi:hypothetical protein
MRESRALRGPASLHCIEAGDSAASDIVSTLIGFGTGNFELSKERDINQNLPDVVWFGDHP